jgi:hypothetical protein
MVVLPIQRILRVQHTLVTFKDQNQNLQDVDNNYMKYL